MIEILSLLSCYRAFLIYFYILLFPNINPYFVLHTDCTGKLIRKYCPRIHVVFAHAKYSSKSKDFLQLLSAQDLFCGNTYVCSFSFLYDYSILIKVGFNSFLRLICLLFFLPKQPQFGMC